MEDNEQIHTDCVCTVCGCVCDDLVLHVRDDRLVQVEKDCKLSRPFFERVGDNPAAPVRIGGQAATVDDAVAEAARLLARSHAPLIFGLSRSATEGQRAAVALAERLGATIDTTASVCHGPSIMAIQQVGESTSTLGEVRHRADLVIFWGADPAESHPRHFERYSVEPSGLFVPHGRQSRHVIVIDSKPTATSQLADEFLQVPKGGDFEIVWALRALVSGNPLPEGLSLGVPVEALQQLAQRMKSCRYGAVFFGLGLAQSRVGHANVEGLLSLVAELNRFTRFTARRLRIPGDVTGADLVLCWQTGFPFAVNLARGYPRYGPGEYSANQLLERGEVDACLMVGSEASEMLSLKACQRLRAMDTIFIDYPNCPPPFEPTVHITTAIVGIHAPGTVYRMDEVPIGVRQVLPARHPADHIVLRAIQRQLDA